VAGQKVAWDAVYGNINVLKSLIFFGYRENLRQYQGVKSDLFCGLQNRVLRFNSGRGLHLQSIDFIEVFSRVRRASSARRVLDLAFGTTP
jgi:hypothetical protein